MNAIVKHDTISAPSNFTPEQIELIKTGLCKGLSDDEFKVFLYTCQRTGLDPFAKQVYAIKRGQQMTIQTGIDGYRLVAERTGRYCPGQKPTYEYDKSGKLLSATAYVKKLTKDGTWHIVEAEASFEEYVQAFNGKPAGLWVKMPRTMLAKCAEAIAIRKCFPAELSGVYTKEEMEQADVEVVNIETKEMPPLEPVKPVEYITEQEADEMRNLILECDPLKQKSICEFLTKKCNGDDIIKLKKECHAKIHALLLERRNEYQALLMKAKMDGDEVEDAE